MSRLFAVLSSVGLRALILLAFLLPAQAETVFVFYEGRTEAGVYDSATLELLAAPAAPEGAFRAVAVGPAGATQATEYLLVGRRGVVALDAQFERIAEIALPFNTEGRPESAAISPDGRSLLIGAGTRLYVVDVESHRLTTTLNVSFRVGSIVSLPDGTSAWVVSANGRVARALDLTVMRLADRALIPPNGASSWSVSPNGARIWAAGTGGLFDLSGSELAAFEGDLDALLTSLDSPRGLTTLNGGSAAPSDDLVRPLLVTDSGRFYFQKSGRVFGGTLFTPGVNDEYRDPRAGRSFGSEAAGIAASPDGSQLWVVSRDGSRLIRFEEGQTRTAALTASPSGVDLAAPRVRQAGMIEQVSPNNPIVAGGTRFELRVRVLDGSGVPQPNVGIFASSIFPTAPEVQCLAGLTGSDGEAVVDCLLGEVTAELSVQIVISTADGRSAAAYSVRAVLPTATEGLSRISDEFTRVQNLGTVTLIVEASRKRLPLAGEPLSITTDPVDPSLLGCPAAAATGQDGRAEIICVAGEAAGAKTVKITVTDSRANSVLFEVSVDPQAKKDNGLTKVSGDNQVIVVGQTTPVPLVVSNFFKDVPRVGARMSLQLPPDVNGFGRPVTCGPEILISDEEGLAQFTCKATGTLFGGSGSSSTTTVGVVDGDVSADHPTPRTMQDPFRITITTGGLAVFSRLELLTDEKPDLPSNVALRDAIVVRAASSDGRPVPNVEIFFFADDPDMIFDPPSTMTGVDGTASTTVTAGCTSGLIFVGTEPGEKLIDLIPKLAPGDFAQLIKTRGDDQVGSPGQPLNQNALVAEAADACGNRISGIRAEWAVRPVFAARLRNVVGVSDSLGKVSALATLGDYGGPLQVEVSSAGVSTSFNLNVALPADQLLIRSGNGQDAQPGSFFPQPLVVETRGTSGFGVGGLPVVFSVLEGAATLDNASMQSDNLGLASARVRLAFGGGRVRVQAAAIDQTVVFTLNAGGDKPLAPLDGFVGGASFQIGWAPGGISSIFGQFLADSEASATVSPLPTELAGVRVLINGVPAPLFFVSPGQINLQAPFETPLGMTTVVIENNGRQTTVSGVPIGRVNPGNFEGDLEGQRIAIALHADFRPVTPSDPALPDEVILLYITGAGRLTPPVSTNQPGSTSPVSNTVLPPMVTIDGVDQQEIASVYAPGFIGLYQINVRIAANTPAGLRTLVVTYDGVPGKAVLIPIG